MHVDFGTGDGTFVRRTAKLQSDVLFIGLDAIADNLREASRRAPDNALFGLLPLEEAPGELAALADRLTVLFPWGSLLRAVALPEPGPLSRLRGLCKSGAQVRFVFEHASGREALESAWREAGLDLRGREMSVEEARALPTTWAKRLGYSGKPRCFRDFQGRAA